MKRLLFALVVAIFQSQCAASFNISETIGASSVVAWQIKIGFTCTKRRDGKG
jgi:hypothetical protein